MIMKLKIRGQGPRGAVNPVKKKVLNGNLFEMELRITIHAEFTGVRGSVVG
jgi:hypothetical protein